MNEDSLCPCGSGLAFAACCGPLLAGDRAASTAESLMRSRYTAYVRRDTAYLLRTWHPSTRPAVLELDDQPAWRRLEIVRCQAGAAVDHEGLVEFKAHFGADEGDRCLHETSRFVREQGQWCYLDGVHRTTAAANPGRNAPCPCGSGRKFKRCCGR